jgi:nucleoside-diphosphate-sugar epimerase
MKITVVGATGLICSKGVDLLEGDGHDVVAASRASGADPANGVVNIGGLEKVSFADLARMVLAKRGADMTVVVDP